MTPILYEHEHKKAGRFSFGQNWHDFLASVTPKRIKIAEASLADFLGGEEGVKDKTFLDIGCGSGLFSLAAWRMGAAKVVSVDVDAASLACVRELRKQHDNPHNWVVKKASALRPKQLETLGTFDVVYAWGVLHHTGDMRAAIKHVTGLVKRDGRLYIAIYNDSQSRTHGSSIFWRAVKRWYNLASQPLKSLSVALYSAYLVVGLALSGKNPIHYIKHYQSARGMSWRHDILDWLGGYPYEFASPATIINYLDTLGFTLAKGHFVPTIGCNEYVFTRSVPAKQLPGVTVLLSVHNSARTVERALESIFRQTLRPQVVCIDDASTDETRTILDRWQRQKGDIFRVIVNERNLGLTKSLNRGLKRITTKYTARLDADDWWEPTKLEKQVNFLEANPDHGVVGCWYTNHSHRSHLRHEPPIDDATIRRTIIGRNPFAHSSVVFRTSLVREIGGYDESVRYGQDYELWLRCLDQTKLANWPQNLCHRTTTGGISIEKQQEQMRLALRTKRRYIQDHQLSPLAYLCLVEPWLISLTPRRIADLKRALTDRPQTKSP